MYGNGDERLMQKGWIKLQRRIQSHWLYQEKRVFSRYEAWLDLLMMANHKERKILIDSKLETVKSGQIITSVRKLCDRFSWSNTKVNSFLKLLEQDEMIAYKSDTKKTVISIVNYGVYHNEETAETTHKHNGNISEAHQKHTNKNVKECIKNVKKKERRKQAYDETSVYYQLATFFFEQIKSNNPDHREPNFQRWADDIRKTIELDKRTEEQVKYLIQWVQKDEFEMVNVLSPAKMRQRWDQLVMKVKRENNSLSNVTPIDKAQQKYNYGF